MRNNFKYKIIMGIIIIVIVISFTVDIVFALKDPSAVYCEEMGYEWVIETVEGGQMGVCKFSETKNCSAWGFLKGECGEEYSYCIKNGYQLKAIDDSEKCLSIPFSSKCAICVLENKTEIEVTELMGLSFEEGVCGDGTCVLGESYENCCIDCGCPAGMECVENECIKDKCGNNLCEPNYNENSETCPQDCPVEIKIDSIIILSVVLIAILIIILFLYKKKKSKVEYLYEKPE